MLDITTLTALDLSPQTPHLGKNAPFTMADPSVHDDRSTCSRLRSRCSR
jgi:hypothetical protein